MNASARLDNAREDALRARAISRALFTVLPHPALLTCIIRAVERATWMLRFRRAAEGAAAQAAGGCERRRAIAAVFDEELLCTEGFRYGMRPLAVSVEFEPHVYGGERLRVPVLVVRECMIVRARNGLRFRKREDREREPVFLLEWDDSEWHHRVRELDPVEGFERNEMDQQAIDAAMLRGFRSMRWRPGETAMRMVALLTTAGVCSCGDDWCMICDRDRGARGSTPGMLGELLRNLQRSNVQGWTDIPGAEDVLARYTDELKRCVDL